MATKVLTKADWDKLGGLLRNGVQEQLKKDKMIYHMYRKSIAGKDKI